MKVRDWSKLSVHQTAVRAVRETDNRLSIQVRDAYARPQHLRENRKGLKDPGVYHDILGYRHR